MNRLLLVTDLDGTLLGDVSALEAFRRWLQAHREAVTLVYATGRTVADVRQLVRLDELPVPDHVVGSVGTEIVAFRLRQPHQQWAIRVERNWNREAICAALASMHTLELQPDEFQSSFKVSYFLDRGAPEQIQQVIDRLAERQLPTDVIYSGNRFVDVVPRGMNKGAAAELLRQQLDFRSDEVVVCGDSGNDVSMCERGFRAVLVANADADLRQRACHPRYHSPFPHAAGVLDGILYWARQQERDTSLVAGHSLKRADAGWVIRGDRRRPDPDAGRDRPE